MSLLARKCIHPAFLGSVKCLQSRFYSGVCCSQHLLLQHVGIIDSKFHCRNRRTLHTSRLHHQMKYRKDDRKNKGDKKGKIAYIKSGMSPTQLADKLTVQQDEVLACLELLTVIYEPDQAIDDIDILKKVCDMLERQYKIVEDKKKSTTSQTKTTQQKPTVNPEDFDIVKQPDADVKSLHPRPPVVTIMGHVDHGKTTLLDALRESSIVDQEFGGITQHIGAFVVKLKSGHSITFLDTPGHQAFSAMRARGASVTDIVILVIAAEDGIMPQTVESIQHAKSANVPLIVAINKIDKHPDSIDKIKNMLATHEVIAEEYGGDVQIVPISALKRINLDMLEESVTTLAEFLELKADPMGLVEGSIIETRSDVGHGKMATILVQRGTLKKGALLITGTTWTKVRAMLDSNGKQIREAPPSTPVEVSGWKEFPNVGDVVLQAESQKRLTQALEYRLKQEELKKLETQLPLIEEKRRAEREIYQTKREEKLQYLKAKKYNLKLSIRHVEGFMYDGFLPENEVMEVERPRFHIVIKGDVAGSLEAILDTLSTFKSDVCDLDILHSGVGDITQNDIEMAELFQGVIYAFNVDVAANVKSNNVTVKHHNVIYHLFNDLTESINQELPNRMEEHVIGEAQILEKFQVSTKLNGKRKQSLVAGCRCISGDLERKHLFKVVRNGEVVVPGDHLASLKHHKDEVSNIETSQECGMQFHLKPSQTFEVGDTVICYQVIDKKLKLDWKPDFTDT